MKKIIGLMAGLLILSACSNIGEPEELVQETDEAEQETAIIPKYNISDDYYKMIVPFKTSSSRGLVVDNLNTRYDIDEFETGLMRMAQATFPTDTHFFQEGQYLDEDTVDTWLEWNDRDPEGLNPPKSEEEDQVILAHILEHNYLVKKDEKTIELGGIAIGLALESDSNNIALIEAKGKEYAKEVVRRMRGMEGLSKVPMVVSLYVQAPKSSIVPGHFIAKAEVSRGSSNIGKWTIVDEQYYFFPSPEAYNEKPDDANKFEILKGDIEEFFPNYTGVIGKAFYQNGELTQMKIKIPMQFYGKAEVIALTQYLTGKIMEYYPEQYLSVEVSISSTNGEEALIVKEPGMDEPFVHIYQ